MGSKSLLKSVLTKATVVMAEKRPILKSILKAKNVYGLADRYRQLTSDFDTSQMNAFMDAVREICGDQSGFVLLSDDVSSSDICSLLEDTIPSLLSTLKHERPANFDKLKVIDWRKLFGIEADPPVEVVIAPPSDDDSGTGTSPPK